jgi:hypothetical protein
VKEEENTTKQKWSSVCLSVREKKITILPRKTTSAGGHLAQSAGYILAVIECYLEIARKTGTCLD